MPVTAETRPVAKKKPPESEPTRKTTTKVDEELIRKAKSIASIRGIDLYELIDGLLRPPIEEEYRRRVRDDKEGGGK
jgi:hypothetical protein